MLQSRSTRPKGPWEQRVRQPATVKSDPVVQSGLSRSLQAKQHRDTT